VTFLTLVLKSFYPLLVNLFFQALIVYLLPAARPGSMYRAAGFALLDVMLALAGVKSFRWWAAVAKRKGAA
jgi:hypothetical protein